MKSQNTLFDYVPTGNRVAEIELTYRNPVQSSQRPKISCSQDAYETFISNWSPQISLLEEFHILLLDQSNRVLGRFIASRGGIAGTVVDIRIIFACALKCRATSIILAHNHPSGNLKPSDQDRRITRKLEQAGKLLDVKVLDHLILSPDGAYYSFADEGYLTS